MTPVDLAPTLQTCNKILNSQTTNDLKNTISRESRKSNPPFKRLGRTVLVVTILKTAVKVKEVMKKMVTSGLKKRRTYCIVIQNAGPAEVSSTDRATHIPSLYAPRTKSDRYSRMILVTLILCVVVDWQNPPTSIGIFRNVSIWNIV